MRQAAINALIREELLNATRLQQQQRSFTLLGRGHENRVTLNRRMAAVLRGCPVPRVTIAGYGANHYYAARVFEQAAMALRARLGWCPFRIDENGSVELIEERQADEAAGASSRSPKLVDSEPARSRSVSRA